MSPPHVGKLVAVLVLALVMFLLVLWQTPAVNGPAYWKWNWRRLEALRLYPAMALAAAPFFLAQFLFARYRISPPRLLPLLVVSTLALQTVVVALETKPASLHPIAEIVEHPYCTSYFSAAQALVARNQEGIWLRYLKTYPERMRRAVMHARGKPPGIILYYYALLNTMPSDRAAALVGGILIALLAACTPPATYGMMRALEFENETSFLTASLVALAPGLILVMPQFDQVYPLFTCAFIATWALALRRDRMILSVLFGLALFLATFLAHHVLVLGLFLAGYTVYHAVTGPRRALRRIASHAAVAIATFALAYLLLWLVTRFDAIATFRGALFTVAEMNEWLARTGRARPWSSTVIFDLTDFAMSAGWILFLLAILSLVSPQPRYHRFIAALALAQIILLALLALLPTETFRTWILLLPILAIPAALELRRWPTSWRVLTFAALWLMLVVIGQNMQFNDWRQPLIGADHASGGQ